MRLIIGLICLCLIFANFAPAEIRSEKQFLWAIGYVESRNNSSAYNKAENAIGYYQIRSAYHKDSGVPGNHTECYSKSYSEKVMRAYWSRWCPGASYEVRARVHNGGPTGHRKPGTASYWSRVREAAKRYPGD